MLGTCAGMILLAARRARRPARPALASAPIDITVRRNGYGRQVDSFETDLEVEGLDVAVPRGVHPRAGRRAHGAAVEVWRYRRRSSGALPSGPITVAAFHPELSGDHRIHERFLQEV